MSFSTAFIFPGQGSQSVGMLAAVVDAEPVVAATFAEANETLGFDLANMILNGPAEDLNNTCNTQPALLAASTALWRLWQQRGGELPAYVAGHSLGEYSALVAAGVLEFADALRIVRNRGLYMQEAVPAGQGAMAAVLGLEDDKVVAQCAEVGQPGEVLSAVNFNAPGQVVIAGTAEAVQRAIPVLTSAGARKVMPLPVSVPSHCALMKPAAEKLAQDLAAITFAAPRIPVVQNVSATIVTNPDELRTNLVSQLYQPVRWVESVQLMVANGINQCYECGPGKVLAGLSKRIDRLLAVVALEEMTAFPNAGNE